MQPANQPTSQPTNTSVVIAGNGPSLKDIDYRRLPKEFDTFRCNQFYFEDKYYLGKHVTKAFFGGFYHIELNTSYAVLESKKEYTIDDRYFAFISVKGSRRIFEYMSCLKFACDIYYVNPKIAKFIDCNRLMRETIPTSGIFMIFTALAMGYKEIYLTGIDFYQGKDRYMYEEKGLLSTFHPFDKSKKGGHSLEFEYECMDFIKTFTDVNIYAISPESALSELFPLAPEQNDNPYIPEDKPEGYLRDIVEPALRARNVKGKLQSIFRKNGLNKEWDYLENSATAKVIFDLIKIPYVVFKLFKKMIFKK